MFYMYYRLTEYCFVAAAEEVIEEPMCESLIAPDNSDMDCNGNSVGSVCEFVCNVGFTRVGAATSTCIQSSNGLHWSDTEPICQPGKLPLCLV